jgi:hypothetical protein
VGKISGSSLLHIAKLDNRARSVADLATVNFFDQECVSFFCLWAYFQYLLLFLFLLFLLLLFLLNNLPFLTRGKTNFIIIILSIRPIGIFVIIFIFWIFGNCTHCYFGVDCFVLLFFELAVFVFFHFMFDSRFKKSLGILSNFQSLLLFKFFKIEVSIIFIYIFDNIHFLCFSSLVYDVDVSGFNTSAERWLTSTCFIGNWVWRPAMLVSISWVLSHACDVQPSYLLLLGLHLP